MKNFSLKDQLIIFVLLWGTLFPFAVEAQSEGGGIVVDPVFQEVTLEKDQTEASFLVAVTNKNPSAVTFSLSALDFGSLDESGGVAFVGGTTDLEKKYALASWMRPEKDTLTILSGQTEKVRVVIANEESLSPGGHYGALVFTVRSDGGEKESENRVAISQRFSVLVFAKKVGGEIYALNLKGKGFVESLFSLPKDVRLRFENKGNVHVVPRGLITLTDPLQREVSRGVINEESALILPETIRVYPTKLKNITPSFFPGYYTLSIAYRFDRKEDFISETERFFLVPSNSLVVGAVLSIVIIIGYIRFRGKTREVL